MFPQQFRVLQNFHECYLNSVETQGKRFLLFWCTKQSCLFFSSNLIKLQGWFYILDSLAADSNITSLRSLTAGCCLCYKNIVFLTEPMDFYVFLFAHKERMIKSKTTTRNKNFFARFKTLNSTFKLESIDILRPKLWPEIEEGYLVVCEIEISVWSQAFYPSHISRVV